MIDNLRNELGDKPGGAEVFNPQGNASGPGGGTFLGMSAFQRFVISALIFLVVCILGIMLVMIRSSALVF